MIIVIDLIIKIIPIKDYETTLTYWNTLLEQFPKGSDNYKQMLRNIAEIKQLVANGAQWN